MKQAIIVVLGAALVVGAVWWFTYDDPALQQQHETAVDLADSVGTEDDPDSTHQPTIESAELVAARQRVADAELALQTAIAQRQAAETDLQTAEREVQELERWVADIEARGENPVDYADEGLEKLQPAFFAYQDAFERYELAETMETTASEELADASASLSIALAAAGVDQ